jgi:hypothetical protein
MHRTAICCMALSSCINLMQYQKVGCIAILNSGKCESHDRRDSARCAPYKHGQEGNPALAVESGILHTTDTVFVFVTLPCKV